MANNKVKVLNVSTAPMRRVGENSPLETQCRAIMITR